MNQGPPVVSKLSLIPAVDTMWLWCEKYYTLSWMKCHGRLRSESKKPAQRRQDQLNTEEDAREEREESQMTQQILAR